MSKGSFANYPDLAEKLTLIPTVCKYSQEEVKSVVYSWRESFVNVAGTTEREKEKYNERISL